MSIKEKLLEIREYCKSAECANCKYFNSACSIEGVTPWDWSDETIDWVASELEDD